MGSVVNKRRGVATGNNDDEDLLFGQAFDAFDFKTLKRILNIYHKKTKPEETARELFERLKRLEVELEARDRSTIRQSLENEEVLTRKMLRDGPRANPNLQNKMSNTGANNSLVEESKVFCSICATDVLASEVPASHPGCLDVTVAGKLYACKTCIERHIKTHQVKPFLSGDTLLKYARYVELRPIRHHSNFTWCLNLKCGHGQIHHKGLAEPKVICKKCSHATCFKHQKPWHAKLSCEQYDKSLSQGDRAAQSDSLEETKKSSAPCPTCKTQVEKIGGCSNVYCLCGTQFNWDAAMSTPK
ncbi:uncharacterized protein LY89DRAFT_754960 [Mollisia scopiformis]|uniref:RBR-type E3 ubiquitin transferase n=1 Tax=Mollisia scopiformis TaxID=149040 RepID=A0A194XU29_MOLSC|nr:uncharacterized protein LY89DRAFT_754960 [Mollisia scopiformis]KUJ23212.1 hypothetical protein LY89DRAFT_754960 [Mollisia scopiformis]